MLMTRLLSATVMITGLLCLIFFAPYYILFSMVAVILLLAAWEWSALSGCSSALVSIGFVVVVSIVLWLPVDGLVLYTVLLAFIACMILWLAVILFQCEGPVRWLYFPFVRLILGCLLFWGFWQSWVFLFEANRWGTTFFWYALLAAPVSDSSAYMMGRLMGKRRFMFRVSPKKTQAGLVGAVIGVFILTLGVSLTQPFSYVQQIILYGFFFCVTAAAVLGDLSISLLKRIEGVKDTGQIIPGHGGVLDRLDSILPVFIVVAFELIVLRGI